MRFLVKVKPPVEHINQSIQDGTFNTKMQQIISPKKTDAEQPSSSWRWLKRRKSQE